MDKFIVFCIMAYALYYLFVRKEEEEVTKEKKQKFAKKESLLIVESFEDFVDEYQIEPIFFDNHKVILHYKNAKGEETNREVLVQVFDGVYIKGYCNLKNEYRTFRADRIIDFFDGQSGENIEISNLNDYFQKAHEKTTRQKKKRR